MSGSKIYNCNKLGTWDAEANLTSDGKQLESGKGEESGFYSISVPGKTTLDGTSDWNKDNIAIFFRGIWLKFDLEQIYKFEKPVEKRIEKSVYTDPSTDNFLQEKTYAYKFVHLDITVELSESIIDDVISLKTAEKIIYSIETKDEAKEINNLFLSIF